MPEVDRCIAPPPPPPLSYPLYLSCGRKGGQTVYLTDRLPDPEITRGEYIPITEPEDRRDPVGPGANSAKIDQVLDRLISRSPRYPVAIDMAGQARISDFL